MTDGFELDGDVCLDLITDLTDVMTDVEHSEKRVDIDFAARDVPDHPIELRLMECADERRKMRQLDQTREYTAVDGIDDER